MSPLAQRTLAFLVGIHEERPARARIAAAVKRSERSVERAIAELVENQCITVGHSGHGLPAKITVISEISKKMAAEPKMAGEWRLNEPKMAAERPAIRAFVKTLEQSSKQPARKPATVEIPPETLTNEFGRTMVNPAWSRVRDALRYGEERIRRARDPDAYRAEIVRREAMR